MYFISDQDCLQYDEGCTLSRRLTLFFICASLLLCCSCSLLYYSAMEHLGKQKRDILVQRLLQVKKDQAATSEQLKTTLEAFKEVTGFNGGKLEENYEHLNREYQRSADRAGQLGKRIDSVDDVAKKMFSEWSGEIGKMRNASLTSQSKTLLANARQQHAQYMRVMRRTQENIKPVLQAFSDQVTFLKHNLNARAISSLKGTSAGINQQAEALIRDINASSKQADAYIQTLSAASADKT